MAINKRGPKWVLDWWNDGKRYRKFFDTRREAERYETDIKSRKDKGGYVAPGRIPLFRDAASAWLRSRVDRAEGSYDEYARRVEHLTRRFGDLKLDRLTHEMISAWRSELAQRLARNTISALVGTLSNIMDGAIRGGQIAGNPVRLLERSYHRAKEGRRESQSVRPEEIFSPDEIRQLIVAARPGLFKTLFTLAAATGMREGELLGLRWSDIAFDGQAHITIRRGLSWAKGPQGGKAVARLTAPKTRAANRDVPIDAAMVVKLKEWRLRAGRNELGLVFPNVNGQPLRRSDVFRDGWKPALKAAGVPYRKFHTLRHSFASALIARGAAVTEVQHLLGHSNSAVTLRVYSHWLKGTDSGAVSAYSAALFATDTK